MNKLTQTIISILLGFAVFFGFSEFADYQDRLIQHRIDVKLCGMYKPVRLTNVLYCHCSDNEIQKPGRCF